VNALAFVRGSLENTGELFVAPHASSLTSEFCIYRLVWFPFNHFYIQM